MIHRSTSGAYLEFGVSPRARGGSLVAWPVSAAAPSMMGVKIEAVLCEPEEEEGRGAGKATVVWPPPPPSSSSSDLMKLTIFCTSSARSASCLFIASTDFSVFSTTSLASWHCLMLLCTASNTSAVTLKEEEEGPCQEMSWQTAVEIGRRLSWQNNTVA